MFREEVKLKVTRIFLGLGIAAASFFAFLRILLKRNFPQKRYSGKPDHAALVLRFHSGCNGVEGLCGKLLNKLTESIFKIMGLQLINEMFMRKFKL